METQQRITIGETAYNIVEEHAKQLVSTLVNCVIKRMRTLGQETIMAPEDFGFINLWEEYCYREQQVHSFGYGMVIDVVLSFCAEVIKELQEKNLVQYKTVLLYFQVSHTGYGYMEDIEVTDCFPANDLYSKVRGIAADYTNVRIREAVSS